MQCVLFVAIFHLNVSGRGSGAELEVRAGMNVTPYYEHDGITIYHGDFSDFAGRSDIRADLLCTDPPYGIGASRRSFYTHGKRACYQARDFGDSDWDDHPAPACLIDAARAACSDAVIWGGNYFELPPSMRWLIWDKQNDGMSFADCEMAWTNQRKATRIFRNRWNGANQQRCGSVKEPRMHPTMKPLPLMK